MAARPLERCERCGRRVVRHGKICRRCAYVGTVRGLRERVLPEIRRAAMSGLRLGSPALQARINAIMVRERLTGGCVA